MKPKIKTTCTKLQLHLLSFCLLCLSGKTRCDGNGPAVVKVEQDSDAVLPCSLSSTENIESYRFEWKKPAQIDGRQKEVFFYDAGITYDSGYEEFKGRVSHFPEELKHGNASIIIRNTKVTDSGNYTCVFPNLQPPQTFHIKLVVEPVVVTVTQDEDALLPCSLSTKENIEQGHFDWNKVAQNNEKQKEVFQYLNGRHSNTGYGSQDKEFKDRVSHFQEELKDANASIIIRNTKVADSGDYTCDFTEPRQTFHIKLVVGTCPKPYLRILRPTTDGMLLQCVVRGASPKPKVEWKDSSGKILLAEEPQVTDRGGLYDIILQTTVTKTDNYSCVSTQEEICHQISDDTHVSVNGAAKKPFITALEQTKDWSRLQCEVQDASPKPKVEWKDSSGNKLPAEEPQVTDKGGGSYDIILQTTVTKTDHYRCVVTQGDINHQTEATIHVYISGGVLKDRSDENIRGAAKKPFITALEQTKDWSRLQCEVQDASPKPKVEWKDSSGNKLPAEEPQVTDRGGGSYDIILQTTVTKTDHYRCVVTQGDINHQTEATIHVYISVERGNPGSGANSSESTGWTVSGVLGGLLFFVIVGGVVLAVLIYMGCIPLNCKKGSPADHKEGSVVPLKSQPSRSQEAPDPET
ncbi:uncharacterized protein LOC125896893 isoform X1 [Epinephelus fuscoguttatus]|uniref:uncharacterized protein LOC125896893 isoform X1 n=1 Tax=Epinephelus fuscoguttatus TaxID=293821 RepID=UPI0020D0A843|nr:uncharacterized protein LOC125896893 isoform X1 [Epinephelus fuscoguttatus]